MKKAEGGKIVIDVPKEFEGKELRIRIIALDNFEECEENWHLLPAKKSWKYYRNLKAQRNTLMSK